MIPGIIEFDWQTTAQGMANQAVTDLTTGGLIFANAALNVIMYYIRIVCIVVIAAGAFIYLTQLDRRMGTRIMKDGVILLVFAIAFPYIIVWVLPLFPPIPVLS